jgi:hypothetical protein
MSTEQWFWGVVTVIVLAAIGWVAIEAVNAPTIEEPTPLDELLNVHTAYPESLVLHSGDDGAGQLCFDCGKEARMHMPWAMAEDGQPIEAALCFMCAVMETSTVTGEEAE